MLRVGSVPYLVGRPLDSGMEEEPSIEFRREVPAALVEGLRTGRLDVALVSSIELFRRPGYGYLEELAVAGRGHVSSVQVFLRRAVEQVRRIALDPSSRTAAALTRSLWPRAGTDPGPEFTAVAPGKDPRDEDADAWLRIGDRALQETLEEPPWPVFNPSGVFAERTGLPFMFALWIVRPGVDVRPFVEVFTRARERGRREARAWVRRESEALELPVPFLERYLDEECFFEPGDALAPSLHAFRDLASARDLARGNLEPRPIPLR